jgi:transposase
MRGKVSGQQAAMFTLCVDDMISADHPLRRIKAAADEELAGMSRLFAGMYSDVGRPSVPPERLLKACLLTALFSVRSERQLCEQLRYNFLFRWFLDMDHLEEPFDASVFAKNRDRLLEADAGRRLLTAVVERANRAGLLSAEHFSVDGTLIEAWASMKSFAPRVDAVPADKPERADVGDKSGDRKDDDDPPAGRNAEVDFKGQKRRNDTHQSTTDPQARLARRGAGKEAKLAFAGHVLMENRNGLCVDIAVTPATGTAEVDAAVDMVRDARRAGFPVRTVGADKGYDKSTFVRPLRRLGVTPHPAARSVGSAVDGRTTRHEGYKVSQMLRKRVEPIFGWFKTVAGFRKTRYKGVERTGLWACLVAAAFNLLRMAKLLAPPKTRVTAG